jgi:hypothetical protein
MTLALGHPALLHQQIPLPFFQLRANLSTEHATPNRQVEYGVADGSGWKPVALVCVHHQITSFPALNLSVPTDKLIFGTTLSDIDMKLSDLPVNSVRQTQLYVILTAWKSG